MTTTVIVAGEAGADFPQSVTHLRENIAEEIEEKFTGEESGADSRKGRRSRGDLCRSRLVTRWRPIPIVEHDDDAEMRCDCDDEEAGRDETATGGGWRWRREREAGTGCDGDWRWVATAVGRDGGGGGSRLEVEVGREWRWVATAATTGEALITAELSTAFPGDGGFVIWATISFLLSQLKQLKQQQHGTMIWGQPKVAHQVFQNRGRNGGSAPSIWVDEFLCVEDLENNWGIDGTTLNYVE
ncbi:hypothetical protein RHGRI_016232 [Rhododendron griersonianum]|uniref:Uncharacterized protein n=1 Tax=Rhododendron griersonianum TaxID=479676 RepID=A0AAV6JRH7_9ERIC|nr:hypothetical protein RHGRI_016232 [Rhododendron griersonianum]